MKVNATNFVKTLTLCIKGETKLRETLHELNLYALETINIGKTTGIDSPIQKLVDSVQTMKGVNGQAIIDWFNEYGMVKFIRLTETGRLVAKYKERKVWFEDEYNSDHEILMQYARENPFWEFSKEIKPNTSAFDVAEQLRRDLKKADTCVNPKDGKPVREVKNEALLEIISYILNNPISSVKEQLGLTKPTEEHDKNKAETYNNEYGNDEADNDHFFAEKDDIIDEILYLLGKPGMKLAA